MKTGRTPRGVGVQWEPSACKSHTDWTFLKILLTLVPSNTMSVSSSEWTLGCPAGYVETQDVPPPSCQISQPLVCGQQRHTWTRPGRMQTEFQDRFGAQVKLQPSARLLFIVLNVSWRCVCPPSGSSPRIRPSVVCLTWTIAVQSEDSSSLTSIHSWEHELWFSVWWISEMKSDLCDEYKPVI